MPRLLTAVSLAAVMLGASACGGSGSGSGKDEDADPAPAAASATPATPAAGFVTERGDDWSYSRPEGWKAVGSGDPGKDKETAIFQSEPGTQGIPSQIGIGVASKYKDKLSTAVRVGRDINTTRFRNYEVTRQRPIEVAGAKAYEVDATYDSYTEEPIPIRIVDVYVQTPGRRQMNFFVRGPATDLDELGLQSLVESFRVLAGKTGSTS